MTWTTGRLLEVAKAWPSNVDKHTVEGQLPIRLCNYTDVYKNSSITGALAFMAATTTPEQLDRFRLRLGDTVITKDSETADDIGVPAYVEYAAPDLVCGYHLAIIRPDRTKADPRYMYWAMASQFVLQQWSVLASGVTRVGIRSNDLQRVLVPLPPLIIQRGIAGYLDRETAQIDALTAKQEKLISVLGERRSVAAAEELGDIVGVGQRLKRSLVERDHRSGESLRHLPLLSVSISWGVRRRDALSDDVPRAEDLSAYKIAEAGDIVVNRMRAFQGALGVAPQRGLVSPDYAVLKTSNLVDPSWIAAVMTSPRFVAEMTSRLKGIGGVNNGTVRTPRINVVDLLDISVRIPCIDQQRAQLATMATMRSRIDSVVAKAERFIELSKERRAALITAAVTGQIDVTGEAA
ncbi:hypothetical protein [uncultured Microbacterium sp.]|uniref:hypothetical protein n=1 Tax=uncultured Microbacterium sp. TaxID=191216 RepID=UPI0035C9F0D8